MKNFERWKYEELELTFGIPRQPFFFLNEYKPLTKTTPVIL
jgi:hypothetical protein